MIAVTLFCDSVRMSGVRVNASVLTRSFGRQIYPAVSQMLSRSLLLAICHSLVVSPQPAVVPFPARFIALMVRVVKKYETRRAAQIRKNYASVSFEIAGPQRARSPATPFKTNKLFFYDRRSRERENEVTLNAQHLPATSNRALKHLQPLVMDSFNSC